MANGLVMSHRRTVTVGRALHFWPRRDDNIAKRYGSPLAATVVAVHVDQTVNLSVLDAEGMPHGYLKIAVYEPDDVVPSGDYATWPLVFEPHPPLVPA
jgi:hypothetical protein